MNTQFLPNPKFHDCILWPLLILIVSLWCPFTASASSVQINDQVQLVRDTPLLLGDQPVRSGKSGETFRVLGQQAAQKKVFLEAKDLRGKTIALNVPEDAVTLVVPDLPKVQAAAVAAAKGAQLGIAQKIVGDALRAKPNDPDLETTRLALENLAQRSNALSRARADQQSNRVEVQRLRHNAEVLDHLNPLDPADHAGQQRAAKLRTDATRLEDQAKSALSGLQSEYDTALVALSKVAGGPASLPGNSTDSEFKPGVPAASTQEKRRDEAMRQSALDETRRRQKEVDRLREWSDDEPVVPTGVRSGEPSYEATVEFINGRIGNHDQKLWFGKRHQKLIIQQAGNYTLVDPGLLNPTIKTFESRDQFRQYHEVQLETTGGHNELEVHRRDDREVHVAHTLTLECSDEIDAEKVAKALRHLVLLCGGQEDLF